MKALQRNTFFALILLIIIGRFLPHPPNFTPLVAVAIFCAAILKNQKLALIIPILALWVSDLVINNVVFSQFYSSFAFFSDAFLWSALALFLIVLIGRFFIKELKPRSIVIASLTSSVLFFLISNFGVWATQFIPYPLNVSGLMMAYEAGLPFLLNQVMGDLVYCGILFGVYIWVARPEMQNEQLG